MALWLAPGLLRACGPDFPNSVLDRGDAGVLEAPIAVFELELKRMELPPARFQARSSGDDALGQTTEADVAELGAALRKTGLEAAKRVEIIRSYKVERAKLVEYHAAVGVWLQSGTGEWTDGQWVRRPSGPRPILESGGVRVPEGLPAEFADYLRGSIAWHSGHTNEARAQWEALLQRPPAERRHRSTWAAYMLGRCWEDEDPQKAIACFQRVRQLARSGFTDRLGLAAAGLGQEARLNLRRGDFERAIELYLEQMAGGDQTAVCSLRLAASRALSQGGAGLATLAANPRTRRVLTALLISQRRYGDLECEPVPESGSPGGTGRPVVDQWLDAVEAADVKDMESAEQLALAAYQSARWDRAQRWINRARATPTAEWLQAKLLLRQGRIAEAATLLNRVARLFPPDASGTNRPAHPGLQDNLYMSGFSYVSSAITVPSQVLAEQGVLHVARREYAESLDALLRAGFWMDAAYVAERVLTLDELKAYVDRCWPPVPSPKTADGGEEQWPSSRPPLDVRQEIRYLLARRLTRMERGNEARAYYPTECLADFDALVARLSDGWDETLPAEGQARALFEAAKIVRWKGLELLGTEVEPDWKINEGEFEGGVSTDQRETNGFSSLLPASGDEIRRGRMHVADPEQRFHYRYQAAALAWKAAGLLPDDSDETARVLCTAGSWLKGRDPAAADFFYKALVRRCRHTALGHQADRMRWFPQLDPNGNPVPWQPDPPKEIDPTAASPNAAPEGDRVGRWYVLNRGNDLEDVVKVARAGNNLELTVTDLLQVNPDVNPGRLKAGQRIFVPEP